MKDGYEKDPFAEYDKYWDELDEQEEDFKKKSDQSYTYGEQRNSANDRQTVAIGMLTVFITFGFFIAVILIIFTGIGFIIFMPFLFVMFMIIVISVMISKIKRNF